MRSPSRSAARLALVIALTAVAPASAAASAPPIAGAAGGDTVELTYPSLVKARVTRATRALKVGIRLLEDGDVSKAKVKLAQARRQTAAAWRGAKYVIRTSPPPVADEDAVPRAHAAGDGPVGPTKAAPADTAFLVLGLHHDIAAAMIQLVDDTRGPGLSLVSTTLTFALTRRDQAIADIVDLAPPAPAADEDSVGPRAKASGGAPVASTFETVMPNAIIDLDDELEGIDGIRSDSNDITAAGRRLLAAAEKRVTRTKRAVNKNWPPVPAED